LGFVFILVNSVIKTVALWVLFLAVSRKHLSQPLGELTALTRNINMDKLDKLRVTINTHGRNELKLLEETTLAGKIEINITVKAQNLQISIRDNGCGMSEASQQKIFEPFYTTKVVGHGTWLGMTISFGIVQEHGGKIEITSKVMQGTRVIIQLPLG
jgi:nitrogen-specific signal transduction histidine kinase